MNTTTNPLDLNVSRADGPVKPGCNIGEDRCKSTQDCSISTKITIQARTDHLPAGKTYSESGGSVSEHPGYYKARTVEVTGEDADAALRTLASVLSSMQPHENLLSTYAANLPDVFYVMPPNDRDPHVPSLADLHAITRAPDGLPVITRRKGGPHFTPSRWLLFDYDPDADLMPRDWIDASDVERWDMLCSAAPEYAHAARMTFNSGSGRVLRADGTPLKSCPGTHTYVLLDREYSVSEIDAIRKALKIRLQNAGLVYSKRDRSGKNQQKALFDPSVIDSSREIFDGPPNVKAPLKVAPFAPRFHSGGTVTPVLDAGSAAERAYTKSTKTTFERGEHGLAEVDRFSLTLNTPLHAKNGERFNVREFLERPELGDNIHVNSPFRKSESFAAILNRMPNGCSLHDFGGPITYFLNFSTDDIDGNLDAALKQLTDAEAHIAQATARAVLGRHFWRAPLQISVQDLISQICGTRGDIDKRDLIKLAKFKSAAITKIAARYARFSPEIGAISAASVSEIRERIANEYDSRGIHIVKAIHDSGKTQHLLRPFALSAQGGAVALAPTISLTRDLASRLGFAHYHDTTYAQKLTLCINSIILDSYRSSLNSADLLLVDEIHRIIKETHTRSSTMGADAQKTWNRLTEMMSASTLTIGVDADLTDLDIKALRNAGLSVVAWEVAGETKKSVDFCTDADAVGELDTLIGNAKAEPVLINADSAKHARMLALYYRALYPELNIIDIQSKEGMATTGEKSVQLLLSDIDTHVTGVDVLIVSPAVESGISLNVPHFKHHFCLYTGTIEPTGLNQQLMRDRTATHWTIGIVGHGKRAMTLTRAGVINDLESCERLITEDCIAAPISAYVSDSVDLSVQSHQALALHLQVLYSLLKQRGWAVGVTASEYRKQGADVLKSAREVLRVATITSALAAPDLPASLIAKLREAPRVTNAESQALMRARIRETTGNIEDEVTDADVEVYRDGKLIGEVRNFEAAVDPAPAQVDESALPANLRAYPVARSLAVKALLDAAGLDLETGAGEVTEAKAAQVWHALKGTDTAGALSHFEIARFGKAQPASCIKWLNTALCKLGIRLEGVGQRNRRYHLDVDEYRTKSGKLTLPGLARMREIAAKRKLAWLSSQIDDLSPIGKGPICDLRADPDDGWEALPALDDAA